MADGAKSTDPAVQSQLDRLNMVSPGRDVLGLERISELLSRLGSPHDRLPPVFHVAGTNGKGSTCAFLRAILEADGKTVHAYSSPHLVCFNERIRIAGKLVGDAELAALLAEVLDHSEDIGASFFEVTTAAAFLAFSRHPADACILEVGLGGRLDATNVISSPAACGIASLGIDHEAFLLSNEEGVPTEPLDRIAFEKASIAKAKTPILTQSYSASMNKVITDITNQVEARLIARGVDWDAKDEANQLKYWDVFGSLDLPLPQMAGQHQADNAALAVAMLRHQTAFDIGESSIAAGIKEATWPARLQKLGNGPLTNIFSSKTDIWLDGGHNWDAGRALASHFDAASDKSIHLIIGMLANKDPAAIINPLHKKLASICSIPIEHHASHPSEVFAKIAHSHKIDFATSPDVTSALNKLANTECETVLIGGSLYLAGEVLALNQELPN